MSHGLMLWDENGNVILDNVDNVGRHFATVRFPEISGTEWVTIPVPNLIPERVAYSLTVATHMFLVVELISGAARARLTKSNSSVGDYQPSFEIHLILTG